MNKLVLLLSKASVLTLLLIGTLLTLSYAMGDEPKRDISPTSPWSKSRTFEVKGRGPITLKKLPTYEAAAEIFGDTKDAYGDKKKNIVLDLCRPNIVTGREPLHIPFKAGSPKPEEFLNNPFGLYSITEDEKPIGIVKVDFPLTDKERSAGGYGIHTEDGERYIKLVVKEYSPFQESGESDAWVYFVDDEDTCRLGPRVLCELYKMLDSVIATEIDGMEYVFPDSMAKFYSITWKGFVCTFNIPDKAAVLFLEAVKAHKIPVIPTLVSPACMTLMFGQGISELSDSACIDIFIELCTPIPSSLTQEDKWSSRVKTYRKLIDTLRVSEHEVIPSEKMMTLEAAHFAKSLYQVDLHFVTHSDPPVKPRKTFKVLAYSAITGLIQLASRKALFASRSKAQFAKFRKEILEAKLEMQ